MNTHRLTPAWFPCLPYRIHPKMLGECLHCGGEARIIETSYPDRLNGQDCFYLSVSCTACGLEFSFSEGAMPGYPANEETKARARTMIATIWNGRQARPPLLSFHEWQAGTAFTGGKSPDWLQDDPRLGL